MSNPYGLTFASALIALVLPATGHTAYAQVGQNAPVAAGDDGIGTVVTQQGTQFDIEGGSFSRDRTNQFHSFESFSLGASESANFIVPDAVQNVVAKVNGSAPSIIDGLVQITGQGSDPNLYLMNPSGILFGPNASLNLPASFTATTASELGFEQGWFTGSADAISALSGQPLGDFRIESGGFVINQAALSVRAEEAITLIGNSVTSVGELSAPSGTVTLAAAPANTLVKLRQPGGLLTLEFESLGAVGEIPNEAANQIAPTEITVSDALSLLTGSEQTQADSLIVSADGTATLAGSLSASGLITTNSESEGGNISLVGSTVALSEATLSADGTTGGGNIRIGGDYRGDRTLPTSQTTHIDSGTAISADAINSGNGGQVVVWGTDTTQYLGGISARGGALDGNGGFVEVSGKKNLVFEGVVDTRAENGEIGSLLIDPENIQIVNGAAAPDNEQILDGSVLLPDSNSSGEAGLLTLAEETLESLSGETNVTLEASNNITIAPLNDKVLSFAPGGGDIIFRADADGDDMGDIIMNDPTTTIVAPSRNITLSGANMQLGSIDTVSTSRASRSGNLTIEATGSVSAGNVDASSSIRGQQSGSVSITAADITSQNITTSSMGRAGDITLVGFAGNIETRELTASANGGENGKISLIPANGTTSDGDPILLPPTVELPDIPEEVPDIPDTTPIESPEDTSLEISEDIPTEDTDLELSPEVVISTEEIPTEVPPEVVIIEETPLEQPSEVALPVEEIPVEAPSEVSLPVEEVPAEAPSEVSLPVEEVPAEVPSEVSLPVEEVSAELPSETPQESAALLSDAPSENAPGSTTAVGSVPLFTTLATGAESSSSISAASTSEESVSEAKSVVLSEAEANEAIAQTETGQTQLFSDYFGKELSTEEVDLAHIQQQLSEIAQKTRSQSAIVYIKAPDEADEQSEQNTLEAIIIPAQGSAIKVSVPNVEAAALQETIISFRNHIFTSARRGTPSYLPDAQQLYQWIMSPIEEAIAQAGIEIDTFAFSMDEGLRTLPIAALHDGESFLVEKYSLGTLPTVGLTNFDYSEIADAQVMAVGVSEFEDKAALPGVALELNNISETWQSKTFINEAATRATLASRDAQSPYAIVHLATHANFKAGALSDAYIQLWDEKLTLNELDSLGWDSPKVDLLILSACSTALGSPSAELGFAGLAIASGARSAIASLWPVDDLGTMVFMDELYQQLGNAPTKAQALQAAQQSLLYGSSYERDIPSELGELLATKDLSHPYYWSGFSLIGSPW